MRLDPEKTRVRYRVLAKIPEMPETSILWTDDRRQATAAELAALEVCDCAVRILDARPPARRA